MTVILGVKLAALLTGGKRDGCRVAEVEGKMMSKERGDRSATRIKQIGAAVGLALGAASIVALGDTALIGAGISIGLVVGVGLFIGAFLCEALNRPGRGGNGNEPL